MPTIAQARDQRVRRYAVDGRFARGINGQREHDVGVVKRLLEIVHMITQACEAMRLHHAHDAPRANAFARRRKDRSEEHTSELQSLMRISYAVFCLKKKKT